MKYKLLIAFLVLYNVLVAQNTSPTVQDEYDTVEINTPLNVDAPGVLTNDSDADGDTITVTEFLVNGSTYTAGQTANLFQGSITINADGSFSFVPTAGYTGDSVPPITYTVSDGTDTSYANLWLTVEEITNLIQVSNIESCNQGYTKDGEYKIMYSFSVRNKSTARDYHENNLIRNLDITNDLSAIFGAGCATVDDINILTSSPTDYVGSPYPEQFSVAAINSDYQNGSSSSIFNQNAIDNFVLYPRQHINIRFCVTVDAFCGGRSNPTPSSSGIDFDNIIQASSSIGNDVANLELTNFHSTQAVVAANLYIPATDPEVNPDATFDYANQVTITNEGTQTANNINFNMGLGGFLDNGLVFRTLKITQVSGPPVTINNNYDGNTNTKLLANNNSLAAGETVVLSIFSLIEPVGGIGDCYFYQDSRSQTQGGADGFDETEADNNRTYSYVQWSDALGNHLDRFYIASSSSDIPSSTSQCTCTNTPMRFNFTATSSNSKVITQENETPDGILEHHQATFQITATNTSAAIQLENIQITDNLNSICGGNIIKVSTPTIVESTATTTPTLNTNFNGTTDINIFNGTTGIIEPNQLITVEFTVLFKEDCIGTNTAEFSGTDPLGTVVTSLNSVNVNAFTDTDNDGISNQNDIDDDNDTIPDVLEYNGQNPLDDADNDHIPNYRDVDFGADANADGIIDIFDFDNDGIPNHFDLDSDNDGILDIVEAGNATSDSNSNGQTNNSVGFNGLDDALEIDDSLNTLINYILPNSDSNGNQDFIDIDADGDGIVDVIEAQTTNDYTAPNNTVSNNGIDTAYTNGITPIDTDNDGTPDYIDTNTDNDIRDDYIEAWDTNNDGIAETTPTNTDSDNDGLDDAYDTNDSEVNPTNGQTPASFPDVDNTDNPEKDWREINAVIILINNVSANESEVLTFTITLVTKNDTSVITQSAFPIEINFSSANGTDTTTEYQVATAPYDYNLIENELLTIPPFTETAQFSVVSLEDNIFELDELFTLNGNITSNNTVNTEIKGVGTIVNNDLPPTISMTNSREDEGVDLKHTITISHPSSTPITINVTTNDDTATSPIDYTSFTETVTINGTINPAEANTQVSFSITTLTDNLNELDEEIINVVGTVTSANVGTQDLTKTGTIVDIDPKPLLIINDVTAVEGEALTFTISIVNPTTNEPMGNYAPINLNLRTTDGTATAPTDFVYFSELAAIPAGEQFINKTVKTVNDNKSEYTETMGLLVSIRSSDVSNTTAAIAGTGTIKDEDVANLFSPNADGKSDVFKIPNLLEFPNFKIEIFDRWGSKIYSYNNNGNPNPEWWDGTRNGEPVPEGVYFYTLHYNDGKTQPKTNFIQLIR